MDDEQGLIDYADLGRRIKAARILAGHESVSAGCAAIEERTGLHVPQRAMYAIEKGEHAPTIEQYIGVLLTYEPPSGGLFFIPAYRADVQRAMTDGPR